MIIIVCIVKTGLYAHIHKSPCAILKIMNGRVSLDKERISGFQG